MSFSRFPIRVKATARSAELKKAIVASFSIDSGAGRMRLSGFDEKDWASVLWWLDVSGIAIYFYHRAHEIGANALLPSEVDRCLAQRLLNNRDRTKSLFNEARVLARWLNSGNVSYALLKGVTLTPHAVQDSALRCQADLDFLVADRFADLARHYVRRLGYRLHAKSGNSLEFRAGASSPPDLANLYSVNTQRALELHLVKESSCEGQLLSRRVVREFDGTRICSLAPADILTEQARHLLKHLCGEHTRLSWVLEFWRHVRSRQGDKQFWDDAASCAAELANGELAMGVAFWLAEEFFGGVEAAIRYPWRREALPVRVRLWLERYGRRLLLSDTIGNKLYALLRDEVPNGAQPLRTTRQILFPRVMPAAILEAAPYESCSERWARYCVETRFILWRLWFHLREGVRFAVEASRWTRVIARAGR